MISFKQKGDFSNLEKFLEKSKKNHFSELDRLGQKGVNALAAATPTNSGETANSWSYEIVRKKNTTSIVWSNSNVIDGVNVAVIIQYGHGTQNGGYVEGRDYINKAIQPIFDEIAESAWKEVTSK